MDEKTLELFKEAAEYSRTANDCLHPALRSETVRKAVFKAYLRGKGYDKVYGDDFVKFCRGEFDENPNLRYDCDPVGMKGPVGIQVVCGGCQESSFPVTEQYPEHWDCDPNEGYINLYRPGEGHPVPWTDGKVWDDHYVAARNVPEELCKSYWKTIWIHW